MKTNPTIEAIKNRLRQEILPEGFIPNSRVAKQIDLLDAMATLEYAKSLNRKVRKALPGECEAQKNEIYKQYQKEKNKPDGMFSASEAAELIGISRHSLQGFKSKNKITPVKIGKRYYYSEGEIVKLKVYCKKAA